MAVINLMLPFTHVDVVNLKTKTIIPDEKNCNSNITLLLNVLFGNSLPRPG